MMNSKRTKEMVSFIAETGNSLVGSLIAITLMSVVSVMSAQTRHVIQKEKLALRVRAEANANQLRKRYALANKSLCSRRLGNDTVVGNLSNAVFLYDQNKREYLASTKMSLSDYSAFQVAVVGKKDSTNQVLVAVDACALANDVDPANESWLKRLPDGRWASCFNEFFLLQSETEGNIRVVKECTNFWEARKIVQDHPLGGATFGPNGISGGIIVEQNNVELQNGWNQALATPLPPETGEGGELGDINSDDPRTGEGGEEGGR